MRMETIVGSRVYKGEEGKAVRVEASRVVLERAGLSRMTRRAERVDTLPPHRRSVERAMLAVEEKLVKALWVLQRSGSSDAPKGYEGKNGLDYMPEAIDIYGQAVDKGGYEIPPPRPAVPHSKEISEAESVKRWLLLLGPLEARVLNVGAMSKRGDAGRRVSWIRVRSRLPELNDMPERTLKHTYTSALRSIVAHLTSERLG
jgi:hypothetical protein